MPQYGFIRSGDIIERFRVNVAWDQENMNRSLWISISERDNLFVFVDDLRRNISGNNFMKYGLFFGHHFFLTLIINHASGYRQIARKKSDILSALRICLVYVPCLAKITGTINFQVTH